MFSTMEEYERQRRRRASLQQQQQQQQQLEEEEESDEDILLTYSTDDDSQTRIRPSRSFSIPLIQLDSSEDETLLIELPIADINDDREGQQPSPATMLMLPELFANSDQQQYEQQQPTRRNSYGVLDAAFDDVVVEVKKQAAANRKLASMKPSPTTTQDPRSMASIFNFPPATLSPVTMRRSSSTPTKIMGLGQRQESPRVPRTPPSSTNSPSDTKTKSRSSGFKRPLANAYSLRKQMSLPIASKDRHPLLLAPDGYYDDSGSSSTSSIADDEMAQLAKELSTPRPKHSKIFRKVPSFRNTSTSQQLTPQNRRSSKAQQEELHRVNTGRTDGSDDELGGLEMASTEDADNRVATRRRISVVSPFQMEEAVEQSVGSTSAREFEPLFQRRSVQYVVYLSTFACFGTIIRVFLGRFFGSDCELQQINDWLSPLSRQICVTASGTTEQTGGALFVDLPANMLGSFVMGLLTVLEPNVWPPIPWLHADHPLQQNDALHVAIKSGMCGSLTTFASWNSQMVVMLDGSQTALGLQIVPALFGYLLGTLAAVASFLFGTQVSGWLNNWRNPVESAIPKRDVENTPPSIHFPQLESQFCQVFKLLSIWRRLPFLILGVLMVLFLVGDLAFDSAFYRTLWLSVLFTPPGALLRWSLAASLNSVTWRHHNNWDWLPVGTLAANLIGCLISILLLAFELRYFTDAAGWTIPIISAIRVGGAGSLSTVSTFVQELVDIANRFPNHAKPYYYGGITFGTAIFLSLIVYIPIVRTK